MCVTDYISPKDHHNIGDCTIYSFCGFELIKIFIVLLSTLDALNVVITFNSSAIGHKL